MPKPNRAEDDLPKNLRPFRFHELDLDYRAGAKNATTDCPFCGKEGKFNILAETGLWRCLSCNEGFEKKDDRGHVRPNRGGNPLEFLQLLWKYSDAVATDYTPLVRQRGLLSPEVLVRWEVVKSVTTGEWLVPAYNLKGTMIQLYRYIKSRVQDKETGEWVEKWRLIPTPEMGGHGLFGMHGLDRKAEEINVHESCWNAMAVEEVSQVKDNTVALSGCSSFEAKWLPLFKGKRVRLWFDNDHPRKHPTIEGAMIPGAGWLYSRAALASLEDVAESAEALRWGEEGYDPSLPAGFDVRDLVTPFRTAEERLEMIGELLPLFVGSEVGAGGRTAAATDGGEQRLRPVYCDAYRDLLTSWKKAFRWRQELDDALSVMLAVCASTEQVGDQLFVMLIADAGSGKTEFCDALLTSDNCYALEGLNGFHSGYNGDGESGGYSLLSRINRKTWVTAEGDILMSNPQFQQIMSQQRRIYDGKSSYSYKNRKDDDSFEGLRTPWIMAGTPALLDSDQARLGDRFLKFFIRQPDEDEQELILMRSAHSAKNAVAVKSGKSARDQVDERTREARQLTGGYVDWLRDNTDLIGQVSMSDDDLRRCAYLGQFTACLRARPGKSKTEEPHDAKEMPTRLTKQFVRLAICLSVVLNKTEVDEEVMRRVRSVAICTASGSTMVIAKNLYREAAEGMYHEALSPLIHKQHEKTKDSLRFLNKINVVRWHKPVDPETGRKLKERWWLTDYMSRLWEKVVIDWGEVAQR